MARRWSDWAKENGGSTSNGASTNTYSGGGRSFNEWLADNTNAGEEYDRKFQADYEQRQRERRQKELNDLLKGAEIKRQFDTTDAIRRQAGAGLNELKQWSRNVGVADVNSTHALSDEADNLEQFFSANKDLFNGRILNEAQNILKNGRAVLQQKDPSIGMNRDQMMDYMYRLGQQKQQAHEQTWNGSMLDNMRKEGSAQDREADAQKRIDALKSYNRELRRQAKLREFEDVTQNPDFEEGSKYRTTANGKGLRIGSYGARLESGFDDLTYDLVNKNEEAIRARQNRNTTAADVESREGTDDAELQRMDDHEIQLFNYLYAQDPNRARDYLSTLRPELRARQAQYEQQEWQQKTKDNFVASSLVSVPMRFIGGLDALVGMAGDKISGRDLDTTAGYLGNLRNSNAIRQTGGEMTGDWMADVVGDAVASYYGTPELKQKVKDNFGGTIKKFGETTYGSIMSQLDQLWNLGVSGGMQNAALVLMSASAVPDTIVTAKENGLSDRDAFGLGLIAGVAEYFTEKVSLEALLDMDSIAKNGIMKYLGKAALAEGSEEVASDFINFVAQEAIAGENSDFNRMVKEYQRQGMSHEEAVKAAWADQVEQSLYSFIGGAIAGGGMGVGFATGHQINQAQMERAGQKIKEDLPAYSPLQNMENGQLAEYAANMQQTEEMDRVSENVLRNAAEQMVAGEEVMPELTEAIMTNDNTLGMLEQETETEINSEEEMISALQKYAAQQAEPQQNQAEQTATEESSPKPRNVPTGVSEALIDRTKSEQQKDSDREMVVNYAENFAKAGMMNIGIAIDDNYNDNYDVVEYNKAVNQLVEAGYNGNDFPNTILPMKAATAIYDAAMKERSVQNVRTETNGLRRDAGRTYGENTGRQGRGVEGRTGAAYQGKRQDGLRGSEARTGVTFETEVRSANSLSLKNGTAEGKVRLVESGLSNADTMAKNMVERAFSGTSVQTFGFGSLTFAGGIQARGAVSGNKIYAKIDHDRFTGASIIYHESSHKYIDQLEAKYGDRKAVVGQLYSDICKEYKDDYINKTFWEPYKEAYEGSGLEDWQIKEELICDLNGGMNELQYMEGYSKAKNATKKVEGVIHGVHQKHLDRLMKMGLEAKRNTQKADNGQAFESRDARFSMDNPVETVGNLVAVHNIFTSELEKALKIGGFPMPSIAITKAEMGHENFGDVSMVFGKETIDPKANRLNKVYSGDAWTPEYPSIDYEANSSVEDKARDLYYNVSGKYGDEIARPMYAADVAGLSDLLNKNGGAEGIIEKYRDDIDMMNFYLAAEKESPIEPIIKTTEERMTDSEIRRANGTIDVLGNEAMEELSNVHGLERLHWMNAHEDELLSVAKEYFKDDGFTDDDIEDIVKTSKKIEIWKSMLAPAVRVYTGDTVTTKTERDRQKEEETIRKSVNKKEYEKWLNDLFSNAEASRGIYNGSDWLTSSGNRRSFKQTHWPETLDNVVRAMKNQGDQGIGAFGHNILGAAPYKYESLNDIREDAERRLKRIDDEEIDRLKKEYHSRFTDIVSDLPIHKDSFHAFDDAAAVFIEAIQKYKTRDAIANYIRKEGKGWMRYSDEAVDEFLDLLNEIRSMPTTYFEAKPQRAIRFNEVKAALVPTGTKQGLIKQLKEAGVQKVVRYKAGDESDRLAKLNSLENVRFSRELDSRGNHLSEQQAEFFKNSKARDKSGKLAVVYHSTQNGGFTIFDSSKSDDKRSFFFTDNYEMSRSYTNRGGDIDPYSFSLPKAEKIENLSDLKLYFDSLRGQDKDELLGVTLYDEDGEQFSSDYWTNDGSLQEYIDRYGENYKAVSGRFEDTDGYGIADFNTFEEMIANLEYAIDYVNNERDGTESLDIPGTYECYLNLTNPLIIDANGSNWDSILDSGYARYSVRSSDGGKTFIVSGYPAALNIDEVREEFGKGLSSQIEEWASWDDEDEDDREYMLDMGAEFYTLDGDAYDPELDGYPMEETTRYWAEEAYDLEYDGVIFRNVQDYGGFGYGAATGDVYVAFSPEQIKATNNYEPTDHPDMRFSRELDARYLDLAKDPEANADELRKMVEEAAREAGYTSPMLYHGTSGFGFTIIDTKKSNDRISFFATDSEKTAGTYSGTNAPRSINNDNGSSLGMYRLYANTDGFLELDANGAQSDHIELGSVATDYNYFINKKSWYSHATAKQIAQYAKKNGYPGVIIRNVIDTASPESRTNENASNVYIFFKPKTQVKSADLVTYDDDGNVVSLSERFNLKNKDIRYSIDTKNFAKNGSLKSYTVKQNRTEETAVSGVSVATKDTTTKDTENRNLSEGQQRFFANSKVRDENGNLMVMYHGTERVGFTVFNPEFSDDGRSLFFTNNLNTAKSYSGSYDTFVPGIYSMKQLNQKLEEMDSERQIYQTDNGYEIRWDDRVEETFKTLREAEQYLREEWSEAFWDEGADRPSNYAVYLNLENPMIIDANGSGWDYLQPEDSIAVEFTFRNGTWEIKHNGEVVDTPDNFDIFKYAEEIGDDDLYEELSYVDDDFDEGEKFHTILDSTGDYAIEWENTRSIAERAWKAGNDGVIFKNIFDNALHATVRESLELSTVAIAFNSNQVKSVDNLNPTDDPDIRYSRETYPAFYSQLERMVEAYKGEKIGSSSLIPYLKGKGIKDEEIKWTGIQTFLEGKKSVSKADLLQYVRDNQLHIEDHELRNADAQAELEELQNSLYEVGLSIDDYVDAMDGELQLFKLDMALTDLLEEGSINDETYERLYDLGMKSVEKRANNETYWEEYALPGGKNYREILYKIPGSSYSNTAMKMHWSSNNRGVLAHARVQDFKDILFVEEIQSDWHNAGQKEGYGEFDIEGFDVDEGPEYFNLSYKGKPYQHKGQYVTISKDYVKNPSAALELMIQKVKSTSVPNAPFKNNYTDFVLKDLLRKAAEEGKNYLAWTTAQMKADRWSDEYMEGYRIEYDQDIPKFLKKYGKQWGAKLTEIPLYNTEYYVFDGESYPVEDIRRDFENIRHELVHYDDESDSYVPTYDSFEEYLEENYEKDLEKSKGMVPAITITDAMRESVLTKGQPMFSRDVEFTGDLPEDLKKMADAYDSLKKDYKQLQTENRKNKGRAEYFKGETKLNVYSDNPQVSNKAAEKIARGYVKTYNLEMDKEEQVALSHKIRKYAEDYLTGKKDFDQLADEVLPLANEIVRNAKEIYESPEKEMIDHIWNTKIKISDTVRTDIPGYAAWKKGYAGKMKISTMDGMPIEDFYRELQDAYGSTLFSDDIMNPTDMLLHIAEITDTLGGDQVYNYSDIYDMAEATQSVAFEIMQDVMSMDLHKTFADREKEKRNRLKKEMQQKAQESIKAVREHREKKLQELKDHYKEVAENKRIRREESADRKALLKIAKRLDKMKTTKTNRELIEQLVGQLDLVAVSITDGKVQNLKGLREWYESQFDDPDFLHNLGIEKAIARLEKKQIAEMNIEDVRELTNILKALEHKLRTDNKLIRDQDRRDVFLMGQQVISNIESGKGKQLGKIDDIFIAGTLTPERAIRRMTDYWDDDPLYRQTLALSKGQRDMISFQMRAGDEFKPWTSDRKFLNRIMGKKADAIKITGEFAGKAVTVDITPAMRMSLYLHSKNDDNMRHIQTGGVRVPDMKYYRKGDMKEAYAHGKLVKLTRTQIMRMAEDMTEQERKACDAIYDYFNGISQQSINEVSEDLYGYSLAEVENYFPINADKNYTKGDSTYQDFIADSTIEGMGFLKERIKANNPIMLRDAFEVLTQSINDTSKFVGLAIPVSNFKKILDVKLVAFEDTVDPMTGRPARQLSDYLNSVRDAIGHQWGTRGQKYIDDMLGDLEGNSRKSRSRLNAAVNRIRSNYAGAVLTLNLSVALKQAASYPTAAAVLGWGPLAKSFGNTRLSGKVDLDLIKQYTPLLWYRMQGYSTQELGDIATQNGLMNRLINGHKALNWIQAVDIATTKKLWKASEYYVRDNFKDLETGSDAYYREVANVYNQVIEETQPNYTTMQRPDLLRDDNALLQSIIMFKTQPFQNFNILYDAIGNYNAKTRHYKAVAGAEDVDMVRKAKEAKDVAGTRLTNAASAMLVSALVFAAMTFAYNMLRRKKDNYEDDDKNMTANSIADGIGKDMIASLVGTVPFGSDIWELLSSIITGEKYYGLNSVTITAMSDFAESIKGICEEVGTVLNSEEEKNGAFWNQKRIKIGKYIENIANAFGVPVANVSKLVNIVTGWAMQTKGETLSEFYGMYLEKGATSQNKKQYADLLLSAYKSGNKKDYKEMRDVLIRDGAMSAEYIDNKIADYEKKMANRKRKEAAGVVGADAVRELNETVKNSNVWKQATKEQQSKINEKILALTAVDKDASRMLEKIEGGKSAGLTAADFILYQAALETVKDDNAYISKDEAKAALNKISISQSEKAYLWSSQNKAEWWQKSNPYK